MASNVSRGARAKGRTKAWLEAQGYQVGDLELVRTLWRGGRPAFSVKRDQFGADLLAVGPRDVIFVQVKSGQSAASGTYPDARRKFAAYVMPPGARQIVVGWPLRARVPRVMELDRAGAYHFNVSIGAKHGEEGKGGESRETPEGVEAEGARVAGDATGPGHGADGTS